MGEAARQLLASFEALTEPDQREVLAQLLRRLIDTTYASPTDVELVQAADQVFQELDRREARD